MNTQQGIYRIKNLVNGKVYIGSSVDVERRLKQHTNLLRTITDISKARGIYMVSKALC